jgi:hypothetical protein
MASAGIWPRRTPRAPGPIPRRPTSASAATDGACAINRSAQRETGTSTAEHGLQSKVDEDTTWTVAPPPVNSGVVQMDPAASGEVPEAAASRSGKRGGAASARGARRSRAAGVRAHRPFRLPVLAARCSPARRGVRKRSDGAGSTCLRLGAGSCVALARRLVPEPGCIGLAPSAAGRELLSACTAPGRWPKRDELAPEGAEPPPAGVGEPPDGHLEPAGSAAKASRIFSWSGAMARDFR